MRHYTYLNVSDCPTPSTEINEFELTMPLRPQASESYLNDDTSNENVLAYGYGVIYTQIIWKNNIKLTK